MLRHKLFKAEKAKADELYQQARLHELHCDALRRQTMGRLRHFAARGDVLAISFLAGAAKSYLNEDHVNSMSLVPLALRWLD